MPGVQVNRFVAFPPGAGPIVRSMTIANFGTGPTTPQFTMPDGITRAVADRAYTTRNLDTEVPAVRSLHAFATATMTYRMFAKVFSSSAAVFGPGPTIIDAHASGSFARGGEYLVQSGQAYVKLKKNAQQGLYACLSHDIVVHEACHALLHGTLNWHDVNFSRDRSKALKQVETRAVTEIVGDMMAMAAMVEHREIVQLALDECDGELEDYTNLVSRFGEIPGKSGQIRDACTPARLPDPAGFGDGQTQGFENLAYRQTQAVTSALYRAAARHAGPRPTVENAQSAFVAVSLGVLSALRHLTRDETSLRDFAAAVIREQPDGLDRQVRNGFREIGLTLEERFPVRRYVRVPRDAHTPDESDMRKAIDQLATQASLDPHIANIEYLRGARSRGFVSQGLWRVDFCDQAQGRSGCLVLDDQLRPLSVLCND